MGNLSIFARRLHEARKRARLSLMDLALDMDLSVAAVHKWETGQTMPRADRLPELAFYLDTTTDWLLGYGRAADRPRAKWLPHRPGDVYACSKCGHGLLISAVFKDRQCIETRTRQLQTDFCAFCGERMQKASGENDPEG